LPVAIGDIMNTDTPPQLLVFPRPAEGVFLRVLRANIGLMRDNYASGEFYLKSILEFPIFNGGGAWH
jgi:hypothetical protein